MKIRIKQCLKGWFIRATSFIRKAEYLNIWSYLRDFVDLLIIYVLFVKWITFYGFPAGKVSSTYCLKTGYPYREKSIKQNPSNALSVQEVWRVLPARQLSFEINWSFIQQRNKRMKNCHLHSALPFWRSTGSQHDLHVPNCYKDRESQR